MTHRLQVAMDRRKSEQETEKLGMKAGLKEKEAFTSRPVQRDGESPGCAGDLYIHNHSTIAEPNAF